MAGFLALRFGAPAFALPPVPGLPHGAVSTHAPPGPSTRYFCGVAAADRYRFRRRLQTSPESAVMRIAKALMCSGVTVMTFSQG
jgi:hypothetical protein